MPSGINLLDNRPMSGIDLLDQRPNVYDFTPSEAAIPYMDLVGSTETELGIPKNLLARLIETESNYDPNAMSPVGAAGIAQIMPDYHPDVDPFDPEASIKYAGGYLAKLYKRFGNWEDALRAYNMGPTALARGDDIPQETQDYVKKITSSTQPETEVKDGLDLIRPGEGATEGPKAPTTQPPAEPATGSTADFYRTNTPPLPFQGLIVPSVTPELAAYMGRHGYGPKTQWNEFGEPVDENGNPYYKPQKATGIVAETLQGLSTLANPFNWNEVAKGIMDFGLSIPAFLTGLIGAAGRGTKELFDQIALEETVDLNRVYDAASRGMQESFAFFEPGKEALLGKPTKESQLPAQIAMAPLTATTEIANRLASWEGFKGYPNIQGALRFGGDALGLITMGMIMHGSSRTKFSRDVKEVVDEAAKIQDTQINLDATPDSLLKQANQAALDAKKAQLELQAQRLAEDVGDDVVLREQMDAIVEAQAKRKIRPTAYTGLKKRTPAQVRAVMERLPEGETPEYLFTSNKGNTYMKVGDTWYDENRVPVTNKSVVEAAEAKKAKPGEKAPDYVPPEQLKAEPVVEDYEPTISDDLAMIDAIEDHFGKKIDEISDEEMETFFTGEEVTDVDVETTPDRELPVFSEESHPFYQDKETAEKFNKIFEKRSQSVAEDPEVFLQKLINDVNRWYHGEEVPIDQVRDALRTLASRADEYHREFLTGRDHFLWKENVKDASHWAAKLDRSKIEPTTPPKVNAMIPLSEIPEVVKKVLGHAIDAIKSVDLYRNKELFDKTGFWFGRDGKWRYELDDSKSMIRRHLLRTADRPRPLEEMFEHPTLYEALPEIKQFSIVMDDRLLPGEGGFDPVNKLISVGPDMNKETILHEIQHAINDTVDSKFLGTNPRAERVKLEMRSIIDRLETLYDHAKTPEVLQQAEALINGLNRQLDEGMLNSGALNIFFQYVDALDAKDVDPGIKANLQRPIHIINAFDHYKIDPGEMESRLVSNRMKMTAERRRTEPPWETLDKMLDKEMYSVSAGHRLYSGIDPKEVIRSAQSFSNYVKEARGLKDFKPVEAAKMLKEHFNRAFIDRSGNIRKKLLKRLGDEGYRIVQAMHLARGASSMAANSLKQMRKEVYSGLSKNEKLILDEVILADRLIDIAKYKTAKEFKFPRPIEDVVRYRNAYRLKKINGLEDISFQRAKVIEQRAEGYFNWMKKALNDLRDEGLISEAEYQDLITHNYRKIELVSEIFDRKYEGKIGDKPRTIYDSGIESLARGRETDIYEPSSEIMALEVMNRTYGRILNNRANKILLELARRYRDNPFARIRESNKDKIPSGWNRYYVYENGERKAIYLSPEMSKEWIISNPDMSYRQSQLVRYASGSPILRTFATGINWGFALANVPRDVMHAWFAARVYENGKWKPVYSSFAPEFGLQISRDIATTFSDALLRKGRYEDYINEGGGMEFLVHQGRLFQRGRHLEGPLDAFYNFMGYFGETSEIMTRLAIRERTLRRIAKREGITLEEARLNKDMAREATFAARDYMDFGQGGWATKAADNAIPYLNASVQGTRGLWRAFKDNPARSMFKLAQFGTAVTGLYIAMRKMHPKSTQALQGNVDMQNNICIPLGDDFGFEDEKGQMHYPYIKIPLDPGQKFFKTMFEAATDKWLGNEVDVNTVVDSLKQFSPVGTSPTDILPPTISSTLGYVTNKDFWLNEDIWRKTDKPFGYPKSQKEYIPGQTPQAFIDLGKLTGLSPERTKYAVEELTTSGTVWSWMLGKGYDATFGDLSKEQKQQHLAMVLSKVPVIRRFFGVTNPYSQHASSIEKAEEDSMYKRWEQNQGLQPLVDSYLFGKEGVTSKKEINDYMRSFKDFDTYKRLKDRFEFQVKTKDLPNRSFWLRLKGLSTEARAQAYQDRMNKSSEEERAQLLREQAKVYKIGGVITPGFRQEVSKLRNRPAP